MTPFDFAVSTL